MKELILRRLNVKNFLIGLLVSTCAVFAPIKMMLISTIVLVFVDLVTGIIAAKKKGQKITSSGIKRTFIKFTVYMTGIMVGFLAETYMLGGYIAISKLAAGLIAVVECVSLYENLNVIYGSDIFKKIVQFLGSEKDKDEK